MRAFAFATIAVLALASPAGAAPRHRAAGPATRSGAQQIGKFDDWTAATRDEAGQTICYLFAYPIASVPTLAGRGRPVLTVTERSSGRDTVAFASGFAFPQNAEASLQIEQASRSFYTTDRFAFARDGSATVTNLRSGRQAIMRSPRPQGGQVTDTFSLRGFDGAYQAVVKACPPQ